MFEFWFQRMVATTKLLLKWHNAGLLWRFMGDLHLEHPQTQCSLERHDLQSKNGMCRLSVEVLSISLNNTFGPILPLLLRKCSYTLSSNLEIVSRNISRRFWTRYHKFGSNTAMHMPIPFFVKRIAMRIPPSEWLKVVYFPFPELGNDSIAYGLPSHAQ